MNVGDEINNSSTTKLNEIWFYEIQNKNGKMLGAEIK